MAAFEIKNLTFTYPQNENPAVRNLSFSVEYGDFITICGKSGCGKSTLLRNLKSVLAPHGKKEGEILFYGRNLDEVSVEEQARRIGYVLQNPDNQIVTDKVWHELAFGLESLGYEREVIRLRVAEMASFFGIQSWFMKNVSELSGGQKQLLNLAAVMAMQPDILILDEPTSQLDPISAGDFLETVKKINREIGTTVIMTEHRLDDVMPMSERVLVMDEGQLIVEGAPEKVGVELLNKNHDMFKAMPGPIQIYADLPKLQNENCPVTVREGRNWLTKSFASAEIKHTKIKLERIESEGYISEENAIEIKEVWFRYNKNDEDVIKDLSLRVNEGEFFALVGGNGTGKTTALSLISGIRKPYRGSIKLKGKAIDKYKERELFNGLVGMLPQNPQSLFVEKTVKLDLLEILDLTKISKEEKEKKVAEIAKLVDIEKILHMHPYDLSGGEQQRAALAKVLLKEPKLLLLDEPTKGIDSHFKIKLAEIFKDLQKRGVTILMVSHDIEFCAKYADRCAMFFDGNIVTINTPNKFFSGNSFYTTSANRMSRHIFQNAVTVKDVIDLCRANLQ